MKNSSAMRRAGWARTAPVRGLREFVQVVGVKSVMRNELSVEVYGLDDLRDLAGPAVLVANHASHLDTAVLLSTLPSKRRRRTAVGIVGDYFFESWLRSSASAIAFNTFPIERERARLPALPPACSPKAGVWSSFLKAPDPVMDSCARSR